jgi:hypothetical protein
MHDKTLRLIEALRLGVDDASVNDLLTCAMHNKMLLELLRKANILGPKRDSEEAKYLETVRFVANFGEILKDFDYSLIKFLKAVAYVPSDIDLLLPVKDVPKVKRILERYGFAQIAKEPFCVSFKGPISVDVYIHPCVANLIYLDGSQLLEHTMNVKIDGVTVKTLSTDAEAVIVAAHAVYKEHLITLNDCLTVKKWLREDVIRLAVETRTDFALQKLIATFERVVKGQLELPLRLGPASIMGLIGSKVIRDSFTRSSINQVIMNLGDSHLPGEISTRIRRITY